MSKSGPSVRAPRFDQFQEHVDAPTLMLGAKDDRDRAAKRRKLALCASRTRWCRRPRRCRGARRPQVRERAQRRVKSISTSAARTAASASMPTTMPVSRAERAPASCPAAGAPEKFESPQAPDPRAASVASMSACPIRPPAPATAMRVGVTCGRCRGTSRKALVAGRGFRRQRFRAAASRVQRGHRRRHLVALPPRELVVDEVHGESAVFERPALALELVT